MDPTKLLSVEEDSALVQIFTLHRPTSVDKSLVIVTKALFATKPTKLMFSHKSIRGRNPDKPFLG